MLGTSSVSLPSARFGLAAGVLRVLVRATFLTSLAGRWFADTLEDGDRAVWAKLKILRSNFDSGRVRIDENDFRKDRIRGILLYMSQNNRPFVLSFPVAISVWFSRWFSGT